MAYLIVAADLVHEFPMRKGRYQVVVRPVCVEVVVAHMGELFEVERDLDVLARRGRRA